MTALTAWLDAAKARADAATNGPWHRSHGEFGCVRYGDYGWVAAGPTGAGPDYDIDTDQGHDDAEFIAHSRTDLPAAIDALRGVTEYVDRLTGSANPAYAKAAREIDAIIATALGVTPDV